MHLGIWVHRTTPHQGALPCVASGEHIVHGGRGMDKVSANEYWVRFLGSRLGRDCSPLLAGHRYILIRRNGVANELEASSRNFDPVTVFEDFK